MNTNTEKIAVSGCRLLRSEFVSEEGDLFMVTYREDPESRFKAFMNALRFLVASLF